jgi:hypothetical protein
MKQHSLERKGKICARCDLYFSTLARRHIGAARTRDKSPATTRKGIFSQLALTDPNK